jgi:UDP-N-acetylmuramate--alanine ligase
VDNALAALIAAEDIGLSAEAIQEGFRHYPGLKRRFELRRWRGRTFVDDYAHHPTAIRLLLETAREVFPGKRLLCAFQPHQLSRTRGLMSEFAESLSLADRVLLLPAFPAREIRSAEHREVSRELAIRVRSAGKPAEFVDDLDHLARTLETAVTSDDIALTVGAGNIDDLYHEFAEKIS